MDDDNDDDDDDEYVWKVLNQLAKCQKLLPASSSSSSSSLIYLPSAQFILEKDGTMDGCMLPQTHTLGPLIMRVFEICWMCN